MNTKKKSKKVKKYAVGGDLRGQQPERLPMPEVGNFGGFGGGGDGSATGQVKAISKAAGRAGDYLSTAGEAIGQGGSGNNSFDPYARLPMKKGGKVKRYDKGKKVKLDTTQYDKQKMMGFDDITVPQGATKADSEPKEKPKKKPGKKKKNMGGMIKYKTGGKITQPRGVGRAVQRKIRSATMM